VTTLRSLALGLVSAAMIAAGTGPAAAQITANGPYYPPPSWDLTMPGASRFIILSNFGGAAVLDRETGLVWERSPSARVFPWSSPFLAETTAHVHCNVGSVGNRLGWRLPTIQELASLADPTQLQPSLPAGHPFILTTEQQRFPTPGFWSATTSDPDTQGPGGYAWYLQFVPLATDLVISNGRKSDRRFAWCVRGGQGVDPQ
jgi:uncharacterized protein DUF1566